MKPLKCIFMHLFKAYHYFPISNITFITNIQTEDLVRLVILMMQISEPMEPINKISNAKGKVQGKETIKAFLKVNLCVIVVQLCA